jgi:chemotaxis protein methyltransferase CheR
MRTDSPPAPLAAEPDLGPVLALVAQERFAEALAALDRLAPAGGRAPQALLVRAALQISTGELGAAEHTCYRLLAIDDQIDEYGAGAHVLLAVGREAGGDPSAAIDHVRRAVEIDPEFAIAHMHLGRLARRGGDRGVAQRAYAQAVRLLPAETDQRILLFGGGFDREALLSLCRTQRAAT